VRDFGQSGLAAGTLVDAPMASKHAANTKPQSLDIGLSLPMGRALHAAQSQIFCMKSRRRIGSPPARGHARFGLRFTGSNHEIETSEMGFNGQFELHQFHAAHVGSGSMLLKKPFCIGDQNFF
jgi:hypothetical protein